MSPRKEGQERWQEQKKEVLLPTAPAPDLASDALLCDDPIR